LLEFELLQAAVTLINLLVEVIRSCHKPPEKKELKELKELRELRENCEVPLVPLGPSIPIFIIW
jgi:hypothetical protein